MTQRAFTFDVTRRITVAFDDAKFAHEVMQEFNNCITDFGTDEDAYREHAVHIATRAINGDDFDPRAFCEGYGIVGVAGITVAIEDEMEFSEIEGEAP